MHNSATPRVRRAAPCYAKGDFDRAIDDYARAVELKPDYDDAYIKRGIAYGDKGEYDRETADHTKAIELRPEEAEAYCGRGFAYGQKGDFDRARRDFKKAVELDQHGPAGAAARSCLKRLEEEHGD